MLKNKLLFGLVIFQGILIIIGIIAIVFGVFYKMNKSSYSGDEINKYIDLNQLSLFDEKHYQQKIIRDNQVFFQIIDIDTNKIKKEIVINE